MAEPIAGELLLAPAAANSYRQGVRREDDQLYGLEIYINQD